MRIFFTALVFIYFLSDEVWGQTKYYAVNAGNWTEANTWDTDPFGTGGAGVPAGGDDVYTNGVSITISTNVACRNIAVQYDFAGGLIFTGGRITVNGAMSGWDGDEFGFNTAPIVNVFQGSTANRIQVYFTASDLSAIGDLFLFDSESLAFWNQESPFNIIQFLLAADTKIDADFDDIITDRFLVRNAFVLQTGFGITGIQVKLVFQVTSGATFKAGVPLMGGINKTNLIPNVAISGGTVNLQSSSFLNASDFTLNGTLEVGFSGEDQTQGWWYQSNAPTDFSGINAASTISFIANTDQNIPAIQYGNLNLNASTNASSKTLANSGTMVVQGDLTIESSNTTLITSSNPSAIEVKGDIINHGTWTPTQLIRFTGTDAQSITGNNPTTFGGGIRIENTTAPVALNNQNIDVNNVFDIEALAAFNPDVQIVSLSGNLINDGILETGSTTAEFIFDGTTTITGTGTHNFNNITINGTVTAPASGTINIAGDFNNNTGTFNDNNGTIVFNGTSIQNITGTAHFYDVQANNDVVNDAQVDLEGILTLGSGVNFDASGTSGSFTLLSDVNGDAFIDIIPTDAELAGNVTFQRYYAASDAWTNFGVPVEGVTVADLQDDFPITGPFTGTSTGAGLSGNPSMAYYNEAVTGDVNLGWVDYPTSSNTEQIDPLRGYSAWMRTEYTGGGATIDATGYINQGQKNLGVTYTNTPNVEGDGWNLVVNPYPAPIDWNATTGWTKVNINGVAAVWSTADYAYVYSDGSWNGIVAPGQAFWVQTNAASPSLVTTESVKNISNRNPNFYRAGEENSRLEIVVSQDKWIDYAYVYFKEEATLEFDNQFDARKLNNESFNISSLTNGGENLAINTLPDGVCSLTQKLKISNTWAGSYEMNFNDFENLANISDIVFTDKLTGQSFSIFDKASYEFSITTDPATFGEDRFELKFHSVEVNAALDFNTIVNNDCENDFIAIEMSDSQRGVAYEVKDSNSNIISNPAVSSGGMVTLYVSKANLADDLNTLSIHASAGSDCSGSAEYTSVIEYDFNAKPEITTVTGDSGCGAGSSVTLRAQGAPENGFYRWYESIDATTAIPGENQDEITIMDLSDTKWLYVSAVNADGCESEKMKAVAEIVRLEEPVITVESQTLTAPVADSYQWYNGDEPITGATEQVFNVSESGNYKVEVFRNGCSAQSAGREFVITGVDDELYKLGLNIYPNPVTDRLNFSGMNNVFDAGETNITLFDASGRKVKGNANLKNSGEGRFYFPMESIKNGTYILNIESMHKIISLHILKR